ncbi:MAG: nucleotidyltransferase domain-containing protein [Thermodesulfovibrio sp.]|nr:nucleotidyltransferase domain-containing protein [Thermodesulfovibrio sp.]
MLHRALQIERLKSVLNFGVQYSESNCLCFMLLDTNKIVNFISEKLKSCPIRVLGAVLYGSVVKGTFTKDSDIDLLIISKEINPVKHKKTQRSG